MHSIGPFVRSITIQVITFSAMRSHRYTLHCNGWYAGQCFFLFFSLHLIEMHSAPIDALASESETHATQLMHVLSLHIYKRKTILRVLGSFMSFSCRLRFRLHFNRFEPFKLLRYWRILVLIAKPIFTVIYLRYGACNWFNTILAEVFHFSSNQRSRGNVQVKMMMKNYLLIGI